MDGADQAGAREGSEAVEEAEGRPSVEEEEAAGAEGGAEGAQPPQEDTVRPRS